MYFDRPQTFTNIGIDFWKVLADGHLKR